MIGAATTVDLTGKIEMVTGNNLNGIAATPDGSTLIVVNSGTGKLYTIGTDTFATQEIDLAGTTMTAGDGILLHGRTLYVVRNRLNGDRRHQPCPRPSQRDRRRRDHERVLRRADHHRPPWQLVVRRERSLWDTQHPTPRPSPPYTSSRGAQHRLGAPHARRSRWAGGYAEVILSAIAVNLLNPKLSIFFFAFLPQFVNADARQSDPADDRTERRVHGADVRGVRRLRAVRRVDPQPRDIATTSPHVDAPLFSPARSSGLA